MGSPGGCLARACQVKLSSKERREIVGLATLLRKGALDRLIKVVIGSSRSVPSVMLQLPAIGLQSR